MKHRRIIKELNVIIRGSADKGFEIPINGYNSFTNNPINIKDAMLKPKENKMVSVMCISFNLNIVRRTNPGINERYMKTMICQKSAGMNDGYIRSMICLDLGMEFKLIAVSIRILMISISLTDLIILSQTPLQEVPLQLAYNLNREIS
jgi:hypothetical protein